MKCRPVPPGASPFQHSQAIRGNARGLPEQGPWVQTAVCRGCGRQLLKKVQHMCDSVSEAWAYYNCIVQADNKLKPKLNTLP